MLSNTQQVIEGIEKLAEVIGSTMGGHGKNVALGNHLTSDGVTIIQNLNFRFDNEGNDTPLAELGRVFALDASTETLKEAGDGTSTTCILLAELLKYKPENRVLFSYYLKEARNLALLSLEQKKLPLNTRQQMIDIANVASKDRKIGALIGEAVWKVGKHGNLVAKDSAESEVRVELIDGYRVEGTGFMSSRFNPQNNRMEFSEPNVLLVRDAIEDFEDMQKIYENYGAYLKKNNKPATTPLLIMAKAIASSALQFMYMNIKKFPIIPVRVADDVVFEDLAFMAGTTEIFGRGDISLNRIWSRTYNGNPYGILSEAMVQNDEFTVLFNRTEDEVDTYCSGLQDPIRISKLKNGIGLVFIGGISETEKNNAADRIDDAIRACFSAYEGYCYGSGSTLADIGDEILKVSKENKRSTVDKIMGEKESAKAQAYAALGFALNKIQQIVFSNASMPVPKGSEKYAPYNVVTNVQDVSIVDSYAVLHAAIKNSVSVAIQLINTEHVHIPMISANDARMMAR